MCAAVACFITLNRYQITREPFSGIRSVIVMKKLKSPFPEFCCPRFLAFARSQLVRINLSEQTDVSDLFGSDLPVPDSDAEPVSTASPSGDTKGSGNGARFAWCDGVFLRALKAGHWVLLDELNLASQVRRWGYLFAEDLMTITLATFRPT